MDLETSANIVGVGVAGAEVVGATSAQIVASLAIKSAFSGQPGLDSLGGLLTKAAEAGVIPSGPARVVEQLITHASQVASGANDVCLNAKQAIEGSPLAGVVTVTCDNAQDAFVSALGSLKTEMLNGPEHLLGGLRMAGIMGLASIFLSRRLTKFWNDRLSLNNDFLAFLAAQGTLVVGSALFNTFVFAPLAKLSFDSGEIGRDIGVGMGMAIVTVVGEVAARRLANLEDLGPSIGVLGIALLRAKGAFRGASTLLHFLR